MTWEQIDKEAGEIRLQTGKTERLQKIPIPPPLLKHIKTLPKAPHGQIPVHEWAEEIVSTQGEVGSLSIQFHKIMSDAGIVPKKPHRKSEDESGKTSKRTVARVSFSQPPSHHNEFAEE